MRALVTGVCGFVGRFLADHLTTCGDQVLGTVLFEDAPGTKRAYETILLDIANYEAVSQVINRFKPDVIYHLAGLSFVPEAENDFKRTLEVNVAGVANIYRVCHLLESGIAVLLVSSAEVFGVVIKERLPLTEDSQCRPANNYSLSKLMAELVAERYAQFGFVRSVIARPFNHTGPGQNERFVASSFAQQLAKIARGKAPPVLRVGNLDAQRDFSDVRDIVRGYRMAALKGKGVYVFCSGKPVSIHNVLSTLVEVSGLKVEIQHEAARMRPSEVALHYGSFAKANSELGWEPAISLRQTLADIYGFWLERV